MHKAPGVAYQCQFLISSPLPCAIYQHYLLVPEHHYSASLVQNQPCRFSYKQEVNYLNVCWQNQFLSSHYVYGLTQLLPLYNEIKL